MLSGNSRIGMPTCRRGARGGEAQGEGKPGRQTRRRPHRALRSPGCGVLPACGPRLGAGHRLRRQSCHDACRDDRLAGRLDGRPRDPQPLRRTDRHRERDLRSQLRLPYPVRSRDPDASSGARDVLEPLARRQDVDLLAAPRRHLAGRATVHVGRRRLHLRLRHRQRHGGVHRLHDVHQAGRSHRPLRGAVLLLASEGQHARARGADPARAYLVEGRPEGGGRQLPQRAARDRHGPLPGRRVSARQIRPARGQQAVLARRPEGRRAPLRDLPGPRHHATGSALGGNRRRGQAPAGIAHDPAGRQEPEPLDTEPAAGGERSRLQLLPRCCLAGQPGASRPSVPPSPELRHRQAGDLPRGLLRPGSPGHDCPRLTLLGRSRLALDAAGERGLHVRPGEGRRTC